MAYLLMEKVDIEFPVFSSQSRGLINSLLRFDRSVEQRIDASIRGGIRVHALRDINLKLNDGDRVALIGGNGAGKTTLLRAMSGIYEPERGEINYSGSISALTDLMLGVDPEASGYDFIITRGIVMGLNKKESRALFPDIEEFTELGEYLHLPVRSYSTGMLLRLAFAISTSIVPEILLMDEMIGVGDSNFIERANIRLNKLMSRVKILVLASHNEEILKSFCSKGIVMSQGRIVYEGELQDCLNFHKSNSSGLILN